MNHSLFQPTGFHDGPIVPSDYPHTSLQTPERFQPTPVHVVAMHRLRANARAWQGRCHPNRANLPEQERNDNYPLEPSFYASRSYYHTRECVPPMGNVQTFLADQQMNPSPQKQQSRPSSYRDNCIYPFTDKSSVNSFQHAATERPASASHWPSYQNISQAAYLRQASEHMSRTCDSLAQTAKATNPPNHTLEFKPVTGTTKVPKRTKDPSFLHGPSIPGSVVRLNPQQDHRYYHNYRHPRPASAPANRPKNFTSGPWAQTLTQDAFRNRNPWHGF
mmetsp:Transcript_24360/g.47903  ORF Transcript_24360/g.47903 Transcript_24360/m.47903 type:complete len:276 (-) Transcript_24360:244-1071(-)